MGSRGVAYLVNRFHCRIHCRVKSNRIFCTGNVKIDGSRQANCIDSQVCQFLGTLKGTVSSDHYKPVNSIFLTDSRRLLLSFFCAHLVAARCLKDRAAALDGVGYISG